MTGARLMFEEVMKYLENKVLTQNVEMSKREREFAPHKAFMASRTSQYAGKPEDFDTLDQKLNQATLDILLTQRKYSTLKLLPLDEAVQRDICVILAALEVSREGLTETQIMNIFNIHSHTWSPLCFAMEYFTISHRGKLGFAISEFKDAVRERYLQSAEEDEHDLDLLELWQWTETKWRDVADMLLKSFDCAVASCYLLTQEGALGEDKSPGARMRVCLAHMRSFFDLVMHFPGVERALEREIRILENAEGKMDEEKRKEFLRDARYYRACNYSSMDRHREAREAHEANLVAFEKKHHIKLSSDVPFKERPRRIPPAMVDEVRRHLAEMLELGVIRKSESPYSSNVVLSSARLLILTLQRLDLVLQKLEDAGLKIRLDKTDLLQRSVSFLGHVVTPEGVHTCPEKIECVKNWPTPKSVKEVQSFLGFAGFYRRFVPHFARIARPLHNLTACPKNGKKQRKFHWGEEEQQAFDQLKARLTSAPVLAYADPQKPFILNTDASTEGLGAVLYQHQDGRDRVIAYASRGLNQAERRYPAHKLEFLALKWAVTDKFHDYLYGANFVVRTDNNPLTYVLTTAKLDAAGHRWVAQLANYNFSLEYRAGRLNRDADALSRIDWGSANTTPAPVVAALLQGKCCSPPLAETVYLGQLVTEQDIDGSATSNQPDWKAEQRADPELLEVINHLQNPTSKVTRTLDPSQKANWKAHAAALAHAYNCTKHDTTGYSPYFLMFGRHPRLPVDLQFGTQPRNPRDQKSYSEYGKALSERLRAAFETVRRHTSAAQQTQKQHYDRRVRGSTVQKGDRVLVRNVTPQGKLDDRWSEEVYLVISQPSEEVPVYQLAPEGGRGRTRTLHRNLLLPISSGEPAELQPQPTTETQPQQPSAETQMQQPSSGPQMPQDPQSVPVQVPKNESTSVQPEPPTDPQVLPELKPEPAQVPKTESSGVCPEAYEEGCFGQMPLEVGNLFTNMALIYRRKKNLDKAEEVYLKYTKANAVGWEHPVIATAFMNLGTLEMHRRNYAKAEEWTRKAIAIYEVNEFEKTKKEFRRCRENLFANMLKQNKMKEVMPLYIEIFDVLKQHGWLDECLAGMHRQVVTYMIENNMYDKAEEVSMALIDSPKVHPQNHAHLFCMDMERPKDQRPVRPYEYTLEAAMDKFPDHSMFNTLCEIKMENQLLPEEDKEGIQKLVERVALRSDKKVLEVMALWLVVADELKKTELLFDVFRGMVEENPKDKHRCAEMGLQFVAVDMRWGITTEASDNAKTVEICLREVDRSDMFVCFFGQQHDDEMRELHKNKVANYTVEDDEAKGKMDDLKKRVADTKAQALAVYFDYPNPLEGARLIFEEVMKYLENSVLTQNVEMSKREKEFAPHKAFMHLYWLPEKLPQGVVCLVATDETDQATLDILLTQCKYDTVRLTPLDEALQRQICVETLAHSGKEFSDHQLKAIISAEQTANPLFLRTVLAELSIFGSFRQLDNKINSLISLASIKELLHNCLERLEADYNVKDYDGNLVGEVLSALALSMEGLTETEIMSIFNIHSHTWSPFCFAIEYFTVSHWGKLEFAIQEFKDAVRERYLRTEEEEKRIREKLIRYFDSVRKQLTPWSPPTQLNKTQNVHAVYELVWLQKAQGDKAGLITSLSDLSVFNILEGNYKLDLLELWQWTQTRGRDVTTMLLNSLDRAITDCYLQMQEGLVGTDVSPGVRMRDCLNHIRAFFNLAMFYPGVERVLERDIHILENAEGKMPEDIRKECLRDAQFYFADNYSSMDRLEEAKDVHEANLAAFEKDLEAKEDKVLRRQIAFTQNGLGIVYMHMGEYDKAVTHLTASADFHKQNTDKLNEAAGYTNLGLVYTYKQELDKALEFNEKALEAYEEGCFGQMPLEVGNLLTNMAIIHRRKENWDKAEELYMKSLQTKANAVGWEHPVIATAYMNLGTLETFRKNHTKAEEWARKAIAIYEANEYEKTRMDYRRCRENLVVQLVKQNKMEELLPLYIEIFDILKQNGWLAECLADIHRQIVDYMIQKGMYDKAEEVSMALIDTPKVHPQNHAHLFAIDMERPKDQRPVRPYEYTLEAAMDKYPQHGLYNTLCQMKMEKQLLPDTDRDGIRKLIQRVAALDDDVKSVEVMTLWMAAADELKKSELLYEALEEMIEEDSSSKQMVRMFLRLCVHMGRAADAAPYLENFCASTKEFSNQGPTQLSPSETYPERSRLDVGLVFAAVEKNFEARQFLTEVITLSSDTPVKDEAQAALDKLPEDSTEDVDSGENK
nr:hypothetical protein BaRGS_018314 [Batillaria attramentaria]